MTQAFVLCVTFALTNIIKEVWRGFIFFFLVSSTLYKHTWYTLFILVFLTFTVSLSFTWWLLMSHSLPSQTPPPLHLLPILVPNKIKQNKALFIIFSSWDKFMFFQHTAEGQYMLGLLLKYYFSSFLCLFFQMC